MRVSGRVARLLDRWQPSESVILGGAALMVGVTSGLGVWLFKQLIEVVHRLAFTDLGGLLEGWGAWAILFIPVLGGLVVGGLLHLFIDEERYHGVAGIMGSVALAGGRLRYKLMPFKAVASAISLGSGASLGPEDPSVQIGANFGSLFGQLLRLSDDRVRTLVAAGVAGGIAAAFNAPIAGVFFALELILGELGSGSFGVVTLVAVISAVLTQALSGTQPAFHIPAYSFYSPWEFPLYLVLGLLAGPLAAAYIRAIYAAQDTFNRWHAPRWLKPVAAGLIVGVVGIFLPQIFGVGYETIERLLGGVNPGVGLLLALVVAKLLLTAISIGGGFLGGVFAPSLFLGATLGAAFGMVAGELFPNMVIVPAAYALVGMAAVLAGAVHAPLTAIILLFEMTNDYRIILPVMFAVAVSLVISRQLQGDSVYSLGLARKGIRLERGRDLEVLEAITVGEVMKQAVPTLRIADSLTAAADLLMRTRHHGLPVVNESGALVGIFTVQDLERGQAETDKPNRLVGQYCTRELLTVFPDETIGTALRRMAPRDIGRLPVVARDNPTRLLGVLRRTDLVRAYDIALSRRAAIRHRAHQVRLGAVGGINVEEITVAPQSQAAGKRISELAWPHQSVVASVRRGRRLLIPHGDTVLQKGDVIVVVVEGDAAAQIQKMCTTAEP